MIFMFLLHKQNLIEGYAFAMNKTFGLLVLTYFTLYIFGKGGGIGQPTFCIINQYFLLDLY